MTELLASSQPGYFEIRLRPEYDRTYISYYCPCGCGELTTLRVVRQDKEPNDGTWLWDGNLERPTLSPSIRHLNGCKFHGHLQAGVWSSAGDGAPVAANVYRGGTTPTPGETPVQHTHDPSKMALFPDCPACKAESEAPNSDEPSAAAQSGAPEPAACKGSADRSAHTWSATPTGDEANLHTCINCGDTLVE